MMAVTWQRMGLVAGALVAASVLAACSSPIADMPSLSSANTQTKPGDAYTYMPVHEMPPDRGEATIPLDQRVKIQAELIAARDHQAAGADANDEGGAKSQPAAAKSKSASPGSAKKQSAKKDPDKKDPDKCGAPGASC